MSVKILAEREGRVRAVDPLKGLIAHGHISQVQILLTTQHTHN